MSDNVRVYEIAEEAGASSTEVIAKAKDLGIELKSPQTAGSFEDAEEIANYIMTGKSSKLAKKPAAKKVVKKKEPVEKETESKEEPKKEEEPKKVETSEKKVEKEEEPKKEELKEESVKSVAPKRVVPKRRGLKIIKKKKPREEPKEQIQTSSSSIEGQPKKAMKSLSEILGGNDKSEDKKETQAQKIARKKEKKKQPPKAHDHGKVIELERGSQSDFSNASDESLLGEEVVLLDMDLSEPSKFLEDNKPKENNKKQQRKQKTRL